MKTTIKLAGGRAIVADQAGQRVKVSLTVGGIVLGADQVEVDSAEVFARGILHIVEEIRSVRTAAQASAAVRTGA